MKCRICSGKSDTEFCERCLPDKEKFLSIEPELNKFDAKMRRGFPGIHRHWTVDWDGNVHAASMAQWSVMMQRAERKIVKQEWIGNARISTVFLGIDHGFGSEIPILWETMAFSNRKAFDQIMDRCGGSKEQAEAMHQRMVEHVSKMEHV